MEWILVGTAVGIVTLRSFVGATIANLMNTKNDEQDSKISNSQSQVNGVNIKCKK